MAPFLHAFSQYLHTQHESFLDALVAAIYQDPESGYATLPVDQVRANSVAIIDALYAALETGDDARLQAIGYQIGLRRATTQMPIDAVMTTIDHFRSQLWRVVDEYAAQTPWPIDQIELVEAGLHRFRNSIVRGYGETLRQSEVRLAEREQMIAELSTPIVPLFDEVLLLPLVGTIDARRASRLIEAVLEQIVRYQAELLIMDMTGVPVVDSAVASHLLQMAQAVQLLGAQIVVIGIGPEMAQTLVHLDIDVTEMHILANLQAAMRYVLDHKGFAITSKTHAALPLVGV